MIWRVRFNSADQQAASNAEKMGIGRVHVLMTTDQVRIPAVVADRDRAVVVVAEMVAGQEGRMSVTSVGARDIGLLLVLNR